MSLFISFEGGDGSGKTTHAKLLYEFLKGEKYKVRLTHEPGGTKYGEWFRKILLEMPKTDNYPVSNRAQVLGFCSARAQLVCEQILPWISKKNAIIISDRYIDSTIAYQVYGGGLVKFREEVMQILAFATHGIKPDLTIYLDVSLEEGLKRTQGRIKKEHEPYEFVDAEQLSFIESNHFDEKDISFHKAVREGYEWVIQNDPDRWWSVSTEQSIGKLSVQIKSRVKKLIDEKEIMPQNDGKKKERKQASKSQLSLVE